MQKRDNASERKGGRGPTRLPVFSCARIGENRPPVPPRCIFFLFSEKMNKHASCEIDFRSSHLRVFISYSCLCERRGREIIVSLSSCLVPGTNYSSCRTILGVVLLAKWFRSLVLLREKESVFFLYCVVFGNKLCWSPAEWFWW